MTDLELTKACAEEMELTVIESRTDQLYGPRVRAFPAHVDHQSMPSSFIYEPLHDDAQMAALIKRFRIRLTEPQDDDDAWLAEIEEPDEDYFCGEAPDLNRAVVTCVARMHAAKVSP